MVVQTERQAWYEMRRRCKRNYTGVSVCERWESFDNFLADVGPRPSPEHSLDRIDNDGDYEPSNVRWATIEQQNRNRSITMLVNMDGATRTLKEWTDLLELPYNTVWRRIGRYGWPAEQALKTPIRPKAPVKQ